MASGLDYCRTDKSGLIGGSVMRAQICFFVSIVFSFVAWGVVAGSVIWPELHRRQRNEALRPLLMFHSLRFVGLAFLVPGVVSPDLPAKAPPTAISSQRRSLC
jgi:hypothetical protein